MTNDYVPDINVGKIESDDLISREEAISAIIDEYYPNAIAIDIVDTIANLPSVTPKAKIGRWITEAQTYYKELKKRGLGVDEYTPYFTDDIACSECLAKYSTLDNETQFFKHCPNCGAKMQETETKIE